MSEPPAKRHAMPPREDIFCTVALFPPQQHPQHQQQQQRWSAEGGVRCPHVLLVVDYKNGTLKVPGGQRDAADADTHAAVNREFQEEVGPCSEKWLDCTFTPHDRTYEFTKTAWGEPKRMVLVVKTAVAPHWPCRPAFSPKCLGETAAVAWMPIESAATFAKNVFPNVFMIPHRSPRLHEQQFLGKIKVWIAIVVNLSPERERQEWEAYAPSFQPAELAGKVREIILAMLASMRRVPLPQPAHAPPVAVGAAAAAAVPPLPAATAPDAVSEAAPASEG